jgi:hypothetical protein
MNHLKESMTRNFLKFSVFPEEAEELKRTLPKGRGSAEIRRLLIDAGYLTAGDKAAEDRRGRYSHCRSTRKASA